MKKLFALMFLGLSLIQAEAQTISQTFNDVSLSEVLRTLNDATSRYDVNFIYNELEDFRVSTSIQNQTGCRAPGGRVLSYASFCCGFPDNRGVYP